MATRAKTKRRRGRGAAAVEFALVLPLLLLLLLGLMDYGWYFFCSLTVTNAAREGARAGTLVPNGDTERAKSTTLTYIQNSGLGGEPTDVNAWTTASPTTVYVDVEMHFRPLIGLVPLPHDAGGSAVARAHAVMQGVP